MLKRIFLYAILFSLFTFSNKLLAANLIAKDTLKPKDTIGIGIFQPDLIDQMMPIIEGVGSNTRDLLRQQSIKPYMMPPRAKSKNGTPIAYVLAACLEYYVNINSNYKTNLSPEYISLVIQNKEKGEKDIAKGLTFLVAEGTVNAAIVPYNSDLISPAVYGTKKHTIKNYLHIIRQSTNKRFKVLDTRKALMRGNPVIIELSVDKDFNTFDHKDFWKPVNIDLKSAPKVPLIVVSYDEEKEAFEVLNVVGRDWGKNGYIWIHYKDFAKYVQNAFVIMPQEKY